MCLSVQQPTKRFVLGLENMPRCLAVPRDGCMFDSAVSQQTNQCATVPYLSHVDALIINAACLQYSCTLMLVFIHTVAKTVNNTTLPSVEMASLVGVS